jgi:hypothetical protein
MSLDEATFKAPITIQASKLEFNNLEGQANKYWFVMVKGNTSSNSNNN